MDGDGSGHGQRGTPHGGIAKMMARHWIRTKTRSFTMVTDKGRGQIMKACCCCSQLKRLTAGRQGHTNMFDPVRDLQSSNDVATSFRNRHPLPSRSRPVRGRQDQMMTSFSRRADTTESEHVRTGGLWRALRFWTDGNSGRKGRAGRLHFRTQAGAPSDPVPGHHLRIPPHPTAPHL